jgi:hypothetical protein
MKTHTLELVTDSSTSSEPRPLCSPSWVCGQAGGWREVRERRRPAACHPRPLPSSQCCRTSEGTFSISPQPYRVFEVEKSLGAKRPLEASQSRLHIFHSPLSTSLRFSDFLLGTQAQGVLRPSWICNFLFGAEVNFNVAVNES